MNYLDVRHLGKDVEDWFKSQGRQCDVSFLGTTDSQLTLRMQVFGQDDFNKMQRICERYNVVVVGWSVNYPAPYQAWLNVTLHLSEVGKNGQPEND